MGPLFLPSWSDSSGRGFVYPGLLDHDSPGCTLFVDGRRTCNPAFGGSAATLSLANINMVVQLWLIIELLTSRIRTCHPYIKKNFYLFMWTKSLEFWGGWNGTGGRIWLPRDWRAVEVELLVLIGTGVLGRLQRGFGACSDVDFSKFCNWWEKKNDLIDNRY